MINKIKKVCCVGAGMIGSSWAVNFSLKGYPVNMYDIRFPDLIDDTRAGIKNTLQYLADQNAIAESDVESALSKINYFSDFEAALEGIQYIQECAGENYKIKQDIIGQIDQYAQTDVIYASSTSGLLVSEIAKFSKHPERCIGAHPYNPPHLIPLVEITKCDNTDPDVIKTAIAFFRDLGKEPVVLQKEAPGFICNRLSYALYREAISLVMSGVCTIEDVDKAVTFGPGLRWAIFGPNMLYELGSTNGIGELFEKTGEMFDSVLADLADWKSFPKDFPTVAQEGVNAEKANFPEHIGKSNEDALKFRNDCLIAMLKLHHKF